MFMMVNNLNTKQIQYNQELKEIETKNSDKEIRTPPNTSPMKQSTKEERF